MKDSALRRPPRVLNRGARSTAHPARRAGVFLVIAASAGMLVANVVELATGILDSFSPQPGAQPDGGGIVASVIATGLYAVIVLGTLLLSAIPALLAVLTMRGARGARVLLLVVSLFLAWSMAASSGGFGAVVAVLLVTGSALTFVPSRGPL